MKWMFAYVPFVMKIRRFMGFMEVCVNLNSFSPLTYFRQGRIVVLLSFRDTFSAPNDWKGFWYTVISQISLFTEITALQRICPKDCSWEMAGQIDTLISFSDTLLSLFSHQLIAVLELGCRRLLFDNGYLASLHRPNVTMDWSGIDSIVEDGIITKKGGKIAYMVFVQLIFHRRKTRSWCYHIFNRFHNRVSLFFFLWESHWFSSFRMTFHSTSKGWKPPSRVIMTLPVDPRPTRGQVFQDFQIFIWS